MYHGSVCIARYKGNYLLINHVPLEEYLFSVLNSESWPGWPLEVNRAFAITSRSYVIAMIMNGKKNDKPYHVIFGGVKGQHCSRCGHQTTISEKNTLLIPATKHIEESRRTN